MNDHEHDEEGNCINPEEPNYRFSWWDMIGLGLITLAGIFSVIGQGLNLFAREMNAQANYERQNVEIAEAMAEREANQRSMSDALNNWLHGSGDDS